MNNTENCGAERGQSIEPEVYHICRIFLFLFLPLLLLIPFSLIPSSKLVLLVQQCFLVMLM